MERLLPETLGGLSAAVPFEIVQGYFNLLILLFLGEFFFLNAFEQFQITDVPS